MKNRIITRARGRARRLPALLAVTSLLAAGLSALAPAPALAADDPCGPLGNPVACENTLDGTPKAQWEKASGGGQTIEGFTTEFSVNAGQTVHFKINTPASSYDIDIYRMGYYGGDGARRITSVPVTADTLPQHQDECDTDETTGLVDCGLWEESASWQVPSSAVSGVYFAHLSRTDGVSDDNHIVFVVRNDDRQSDMVFQTSDTTWQAYNQWGGNSLYGGNSAIAPGRAVKVSYNRPFSTRENTPWGRDFVFANEYPMIRFLEANGYDVSYLSGIDTDRSGSLLLNHQTFLSVGHDEYWSGAQRANVEAARDAGVDLAFFSGNEVYWKVRWENSIDESNTPYRTMVVYKETNADSKIDPSPEWTGTWRDDRFSPPSNGGRPENALTGTLFTVNCCGTTLKVPAADGRMRFWRGTDVAGLGDGQTATLADHTVGYEWDEDVDNGHRPAGLFRMSTTTATVQEKLVELGPEVEVAEATHHLTMYKAPSGALVFGAGTVQWSWGLDPEHDGHGEAPQTADPAMRQATVNLFADMGVQPDTLQPDLSPAVQTTDATAPISTITSPVPGADLANGTAVTITGTATDIGGRVAGVEVSTDGGQTWHPAQGRDNWTYSWDAQGMGQVPIKVRAVDDSGNLEAVDAGTTVDVSCPCRLFGDSVVPEVPADADTTPTEVGVKFSSSVGGWVSGIRFYKGAGNTGNHVGTLWDASGNPIATANFTNETATGWQTAEFGSAIEIQPDTTYVVSYFAPNGRYAADASYFSKKPLTNGPLTSPQATDTVANGVYRSGYSAFPTSTFKGGNYYVDLVFHTVEPPDVLPPTVTSHTPIDNASTVPTTTKPSVTFNEPIQAGTGTFTVKDGDTVIPGSAALDTGRTKLTFTPSNPLPYGRTLTVNVTGAQDDAGNPMSALNFSFEVAAAPPAAGQCPCSIWTDEATPAIEGNNDDDPVNLGVKFVPEQDGYIRGIRFYKGRDNTGTHTGTLWDAAGNEKATATFVDESAMGWQTVYFSSPVEVEAGQTYVASYHTTAGFYSVTGNGLNTPVVNGPLSTLPNSQGGNGVYKYGSRSFPTNSWGATNYWVDVVFTLPPDHTPPSVAKTSPSADATSIPTGAAMKITFNEPVQADSGTVDLRANDGTVAPGTGSLDATGRVLTYTPSSALTAATRYRLEVSGFEDIAGNTMSGYHTIEFTTAGACPCTLFPSDAAPVKPAENDSGAVEVGMKFSPDTDGWITGVRFYKGEGNTGTHIGSLWTASGSRIRYGTFQNETASGWQTLTFPAPVQVTAGTTYVVSYHAPNGHYAATGGQFTDPVDNAPLHAPSSGAAGGNGVYRYTGSPAFPTSTYGAANYWVDPVFTTAEPDDTSPPSVEAAHPVDGATTVPRATSPSVTFNEPVQSGTLQMSMTGPNNTVVNGTLSYNATTRTATFDPNATLDWNTRYTVRVDHAEDIAGHPLAAPHTWSFTTAEQQAAGVHSIWDDETVPQIVNDNDGASIEVGLKFRTDTDGWITGMRFYKGSQNTGTHVGRLWDAAGNEIAQVTFVDESAAGWQTAMFSTPIQVNANETYVVSYVAPNGHYSANSDQFVNAGVDNPPLHALRSGEDGANGVYRYGSGGVFPQSPSNSNYWVDVLFTTTQP